MTILALLAGALLVGAGVYLNRQTIFGGPAASDGGAGPSDSAGRDPIAGDFGTVLDKRKPASRDAPFARLSVSPETVDLGRVSTCGERQSFDLAIRNEGDAPVRVDAWVSTCACLIPKAEPGFTIKPRDVYTLPVAVEPWNFGPQSHRIDFRVSGDGLSPNAIGGRVRVNFTVAGPLRARPAVVTRPEGKRNFAVNIDRVTSEGAFSPVAYEVLGVEPRVAQILQPLEDGHGAINIDFQAIDELAKAPAAESNPAIEWSDTAEGKRWKSIELTVRTTVEECPEIRVRVRNRGQ